MIKSGQAYHAAITGDARRVLLRAVIDIISPDIVFGAGETSGQIPWSKPEQLHDKVFGNPAKYATLERDRWALDGTWDLLPDDPTQTVGQMGYIGSVLSGTDGTFSTPPWVEMQFSGVSVLQACSVYFPDNDYDGLPEDFTVEVKQGGTAYHTRTYTGNTAPSVSLEGFTVNNPDAIRVTVTKWSRPSRRMRVVEIVPGVYEGWDGGMIAEFNVKQQGNIAATALPYGTCTLKIDNLSRRFEPRSKNGIFQSIEERQGIDISLGVRLADGTDEYKRLGIFYQYSGGWKTGDNGLTMQWNQVDINGLLANREFLAPSTLPTTLGGWISALAAQLVAEVNAERAQRGLTLLSEDSDLTAAACTRAREIASVFSHTRPDGSSCFTVSEKAYGENIAKGYGTVDKVMAAWISSEGHRANILRASYGSIGVCCLQIDGVYYWVQLFGK